MPDWKASIKMLWCERHKSLECKKLFILGTASYCWYTHYTQVRTTLKHNAHIYQKKCFSLRHPIMSHLFAHALILCSPIVLVTNGHIFPYFCLPNINENQILIVPVVSQYKEDAPQKHAISLYWKCLTWFASDFPILLKIYFVTNSKKCFPEDMKHQR